MNKILLPKLLTNVTKRYILTIAGVTDEDFRFRRPVMSWDKNTIITSSVDSIIETLNNLNTPYCLEEIGKVRGDGLNDDYNGIDFYPLRKLEYEGFVVLEQIIRTTDCDTDDTIISKSFPKDKIPKRWKKEVIIVNS